MKKHTLLLLLPLLLIFSNCKKDDDQHQDPVDLLPPATQTGAGTFAALVDGKPFIDKSGGWFNCFYQLVDGEYYFSIQGIDNNSILYDLSLGAFKKQVFEGETYQLLEELEGNVIGGGGYIFSPTDYQVSFTSTEYSGELTITKLNYDNNIVSGTFWFDLEHPVTGERVEIREGRFDTLFTQ